LILNPGATNTRRQHRRDCGKLPPEPPAMRHVPLPVALPHRSAPALHDTVPCLSRTRRIAELAPWYIQMDWVSFRYTSTSRSTTFSQSENAGSRGGVGTILVSSLKDGLISRQVYQARPSTLTSHHQISRRAIASACEPARRGDAPALAWPSSARCLPPSWRGDDVCRPLLVACRRRDGDAMVTRWGEFIKRPPTETASCPLWVQV
jgi:hypothetical protein